MHPSGPRHGPSVNSPSPQSFSSLADFGNGSGSAAASGIDAIKRAAKGRRIGRLRGRAAIVGEPTGPVNRVPRSLLFHFAEAHDEGRPVRAGPLDHLQSVESFEDGEQGVELTPEIDRVRALHAG